MRANTQPLQDVFPRVLIPIEILRQAFDTVGLAFFILGIWAMKPCFLEISMVEIPCLQFFRFQKLLFDSRPAGFEGSMDLFCRQAKVKDVSRLPKRDLSPAVDHYQYNCFKVGSFWLRLMAVLIDCL